MYCQLFSISCNLRFSLWKGSNKQAPTGSVTRLFFWKHARLQRFGSSTWWAKCCINLCKHEECVQTSNISHLPDGWDIKHVQQDVNRMNTGADGQIRQKCTYYQDKDHGTLVDVVSVDAGSFSKPAPEMSRQANVIMLSLVFPSVLRMNANNLCEQQLIWNNVGGICSELATKIQFFWINENICH